MNTRLIPIILLYCFSMTACVSSRNTTHWIINNDSDKDVSINLNVSRNGSPHLTKAHVVKPGLQEFGSETFPKGSYAIEAVSGDGTVSSLKRVYLDTETWVIISFTRADSINLQHKYGYIDPTTFKKIDDKFAGIDIYKECRKPPFLYNFTVNNK